MPKMNQSVKFNRNRHDRDSESAGMYTTLRDKLYKDN